jgi:hypothetical protein
MIGISKFAKYGLKVTWTLLDIGYNGKSVLGQQFLGSEIISYALSALIDGDKSLDVAFLASLQRSEEDEIGPVLTKLSALENLDVSVEFRKIRSVFVAEQLMEFDDFVYGLVQLGEIWIDLGFPAGSPHVFQGKDNNITPQEYYTRNNYLYLLDRHRAWLDIEINELSHKDR